MSDRPSAIAPGRPDARPRPLALHLADGRAATVTLSSSSTVVAVEETQVSAYDLSGRPFALVRDGWTWRRALDGRWLRKGYDASHRRVRQRLPPEQGDVVLEAARSETVAALEAVRQQPDIGETVRYEACRRLRRILSMDHRALARDVALFASLYGPVGILPPDQYLSCVVQITEGCYWNACTFCDFYKGRPFRVKSGTELSEHLAAVKAFFGDSLCLRPRVFLGSANALGVSDLRLRPLLEDVARSFPAATGLFSFVDAWTGRRKSIEDYRAYARLGLRRVYLGLESGDPSLLVWLRKPGHPDDAVTLVDYLHQAGVGVAVIVLIGVGGERFFDAHVSRTVEVLRAMRLRPDDLVYLADLVESPSSEYARRAEAEVLDVLTPGRLARQRRLIASALQEGGTGRSPRISTYDIREFIY